ncbi:MAG: M42 family metallopeptidase [Ruminococcaceae bacterium]|nr:M42 family metallopeptidase [Oscillospiraceae bacterium]
MLIDTIKALCSLPGISGDESQVREYIAEAVKPYADEIRVQKNGTLLAFRQGHEHTYKPLMLAAHMDEVGFMVKNITDDGFLKFSAVGGIDDRILTGQRVKIGKNGVLGVIGKKAIHLLSETEYKKPVKIEDLVIDIGAADKEQAQALVSLGDSVVFDSDTVLFGDGYIKAKALDDRAGCAILMELIKEKPRYDTWFVFTVMEEIGCYGASAAANAVKPSVAIVVETTTAADFAGRDDGKCACILGKGAVVPVMDRSTIADRALHAKVTALANDKNIAWQPKTMIAGGTDASQIQRSLDGVRVVTVSAPCRNIHSPSCVLKLSDIQAQYELVAEASKMDF